MTLLDDPRPTTHAPLGEPGEMTGPSSRVLADSVGPDGTRLTTFEDVMHRWVLAENNTHKVVSKCAGSSRAVPVEKQIARMLKNPALPVHYGQEQKGMQAQREVDAESATLIEHRWLRLLRHSIQEVEEMRSLGLHKQVANRLLEPYTYIRLVQTATAWENFLDLRDHPDAQPEIQALAAAKRAALDASTPVVLDEGEWHLPYIAVEDRIEVAERLADGDPVLLNRTLGQVPLRDGGITLDAQRILAQMSAARCARTSYLTLPVIAADGTTVEARRDIVKDFAVCDTLIGSTPRHWSPFEHQATPWIANRQWEPVPFEIPVRHGNVIRFTAPTDHLPRIGNLLAFRSQRTETEAVLQEITYR